MKTIQLLGDKAPKKPSYTQLIAKEKGTKESNIRNIQLMLEERREQLEHICKANDIGTKVVRFMDFNEMLLRDKKDILSVPHDNRTEFPSLAHQQGGRFHMHPGVRGEEDIQKDFNKKSKSERKCSHLSKSDKRKYSTSRVKQHKKHKKVDRLDIKLPKLITADKVPVDKEAALSWSRHLMSL